MWAIREAALSSHQTNFGETEQVYLAVKDKSIKPTMDGEFDQKGFQSSLVAWFENHGRSFPWRSNPDPFEILLAEILLQRTFAEKVEPVFNNLRREYSTPRLLAEADSDVIRKELTPLGLQRKKTEALQKISQEIAEEGVPSTEEELLKLPQVGCYGANAVLCFGYGKPRPIVDTNVIRIFNRVFDTDFEDHRKEGVWKKAAALLPEQDFQKYNLGLVDLGAMICTPSDPKCTQCPVNAYCRYYQKKCISKSGDA